MVFLFVCRFVSFFDMTLIGSDTIVMEGMGCFVFTSIPISLKIMRGKKKAATEEEKSRTARGRACLRAGS
jgi:hypothetical protein